MGCFNFTFFRTKNQKNTHLRPLGFGGQAPTKNLVWGIIYYKNRENFLLLLYENRPT